MRIYAKETFVFGKPRDIFTPAVLVSAGSITDVPDWVEKDITFKKAQKAGMVEVLENKEQQLKAELDAAKAPQKKTRKKGD